MKGFFFKLTDNGIVEFQSQCWKSDWVQILQTMATILNFIMLHVRWCKVPEFLLSSVFLLAECSLFPCSLQQLGFVSCVYISDSFPVFLITLLHLLHQNLSGIAAKFTTLSFRRKTWSYWGDCKHQTTFWSSGDDFLIIHYGGQKEQLTTLESQNLTVNKANSTPEV